MRKVTTLLFVALLFGTSASQAQQAETDFVLTVPVSDQLSDPYNTVHPNGNWGARGVSGPFDLDGDGHVEVLLTDYTGGGRVHVVEHESGSDWSLVYSTPALDSTSTDRNVRYATGGDLDGDGKGEIIFLSGWLYQEGPYGLYDYEYTGTDNKYGSEPALTYDFGTLQSAPAPIRSEIMHAEDIDGDSMQELIFANNGSATGDDWFIMSVTGDIEIGGFASVNVESRISSGNTEYDPVDRGGGSPYGIEIADLDGEGLPEISMNSWNSFNFTNGDVAGADAYTFPKQGASNAFFHATEDINEDDLSFYSGTVADINQDGDDEVFYPREFSYETQGVSVLNYEEGENVLQVTPDNVVLDVISGDSLDGLTHWGITSGNLDDDDAKELIGTGWNFLPTAYEAGRPSHFLHVADFTGGPGGDPEDPANYEITKVETPSPLDTLSFNIVHRDSLGTESTYRELRGGSDYDEALIPSKLAYLGDVDDDGSPEIAASFRNTFDTLFVYNENFVQQSDTSFFERTVAQSISTDHPVLRIYTLDETVLPTQKLPSKQKGYALSRNHPNPVSRGTRFSYTLPHPDAVSVRIYDVMGRTVATLLNGAQRSAGTHHLRWDGTAGDGRRLASGVYFYTLEHGAGRLTRKMVLVK